MGPFSRVQRAYAIPNKVACREGSCAESSSRWKASTRTRLANLAVRFDVIVLHHSHIGEVTAPGCLREAQRSKESVAP
jgi:hypothetical protein